MDPVSEEITRIQGWIAELDSLSVRMKQGFPVLSEHLDSVLCELAAEQVLILELHGPLVWSRNA